MFPWLWFWAPQIHFPWSGSVAQQIEPSTSWFFDGIRPSAGVAGIEKRAFDVATYGRQLGLITEVLLELAERSQPLSAAAARSVERLKAIQAAIENIKVEEDRLSALQIESRLAELKERSSGEFRLLSERLLPLLGASATR
jgi:hypothetical protein